MERERREEEKMYSAIQQGAGRKAIEAVRADSSMQMKTILAELNGSKCILQLRGVRPFLSDKFDITKHKRYKELSDFDEKNAFDVERYLKHELRLRMDEEFDCYEVDMTPTTDD